MSQTVKTSRRTTQAVSPSAITPIKKVLSSEDEKLLFCAVNKLRDEYIPVEKLSAGLYGRIYTTCRLDEDGRPAQPCDLVLKVIRFNPDQSQKENLEILDNEFKLGQEAGELGVGPKVYDYGFCNNSDAVPNKSFIRYTAASKMPELKNPTALKTIGWILMERLPYPTLSETYPYPQWAIESTLGNYYRLITERNISQNDLKGDNILVDPKGQRTYILDYGFAQPYTERLQGFLDIFQQKGWDKVYSPKQLDYLALRWEMKQVSDQFLKTLTHQFQMYSISRDQWIVDSPKGSTQALINVLTGLNNWYNHQFRVPPGYIAFWYKKLNMILDKNLYDSWADLQGEHIDPKSDTW